MFHGWYPNIRQVGHCWGRRERASHKDILLYFFRLAGHEHRAASATAVIFRSEIT